MKRKEWLKSLKVGDKVFVERVGGSPYLEFTLYTVVLILIMEKLNERKI